MKTLPIGAFEAKTHLSALLEKVQQGQVYCITKRGRPVAELRPAQSVQRRPLFGCDRGRVTVRKDFDAPLDDFREYTT
ncbi:MAG: type II toxin-antitoxin system Phd/YefM family antitoxin [Kiritimatiellaeota bacterium]|nr:type II toxin-antitoxin system Phd/YefM family antitoxin [Kiritimatiellota bacterium]